MPACLRPLWPKGFGQYGDNIEAARPTFAAAFPDPVERVCVLYGWYGSGAGPWSGYPSYESAVERLLMEYPIETLIRAVATDLATELELLGAARLFGGWDFGQKRKADRSRCPESLRARMLREVERQGIADNLDRFRHTFGIPG